MKVQSIVLPAWSFTENPWPLILYDVPITAVEQKESTISSSLQKWLGILPSFTNVGLYGRETNIQLPFTVLSDEFKVSKSLNCNRYPNLKRRMCLKSRCDPAKWALHNAANEATCCLKHQDIVGRVCIG